MWTKTLAEFMADSQVPWGLEAAGGTITEPAWRSKPSWYLVTTDDRMIPPPLQREMSERAGATVVETPGSHSIYVSKPDVVAGLIERAASEVAIASDRLEQGPDTGPPPPISGRAGAEPGLAPAQGSFRSTGPGERAAARRNLSCRREHLPRDRDCRRQRVHARGRRLGIHLGSEEGRRGRPGRPEAPRLPPTHSARAIAQDPSFPLIVGGSFPTTRPSERCWPG